MKIIIFFCLLFWSSFTPSADENVFSLSFGPVSIGEARVPISVSDFEVGMDIPSEKISVSIEPESVQWVRGEQNILSPRARIILKIKGDPKLLHLSYQEKKIVLQAASKTEAFTTLYVSLFYPESLKVYEGEKYWGQIQVRPKVKQKTAFKKSKLIDYSCAPYNFEVKGLDQEYISVSCRLGRMGNFGSEKPFLEVYWTATNVRLLDGSSPPYVAILSDSSPVIVQMKYPDGQKAHIQLKAKLPKRSYRFKTALGFGPYTVTAQEGEEKNVAKLAPAGMLYAHFSLGESSSFRAFDALVSQKSFFNNAGLYFAYELGRAFDQRVEVVALLGFQSLTYRYDKNHLSDTQLIYPQGVEVVFKHFAGLENYDLIYGMFISPSKNEDYKNLWLRWGRRVFGEVNYISWSNQEKKVSMWGLSLGFPFVSLF